jgi:hypothetical protein
MVTCAALLIYIQKLKSSQEEEGKLSANLE